MLLLKVPEHVYDHHMFDLPLSFVSGIIFSFL
jgi:hypothetical protein